MQIRVKKLHQRCCRHRHSPVPRIRGKKLHPAKGRKQQHKYTSFANCGKNHPFCKNSDFSLPLPSVMELSDSIIPDQYQSIAAPSTGIYKEKGSKFLAFAFPVSTEEEIKTHLQDLRKEYFDARHHCYAYRLGADGAVWRANDDGEPSSSGGKPILGQLLSFQLSDILVVVVRYFGGVKLGVSGLINAYRQAAADALEHSSLIVKYDECAAQMHFPYAQMSAVMKALKPFPVRITHQQINQDCCLWLSVPRSQYPPLALKLSTLPQLLITPTPATLPPA